MSTTTPEPDDSTTHPTGGSATPSPDATHEEAFAGDGQDRTGPETPHHAANAQPPHGTQAQHAHTQHTHAQYAPTAPAPMLESDARMWAMFTHVGALIAATISASILGFVVPLVIWLIYRERSALVGHHGRQQLNLQLTALCVGLGAVVIGLATLLFGFIITLPLFIAYWIYSIVVSIIAAVKANNGDYYRIKLVIPFFK